MVTKKDCGCKAGRDINKLQWLFGSRNEKEASSFKFVLNTMINLLGVIVFVVLSVFAIPFVLYNAYENKKRTGRPFVSLPGALKKPMKYVLGTDKKPIRTDKMSVGRVDRENREQDGQQ